MGVEYKDVIERLEKIIENWFDKKELAASLLYPDLGLCINLTYYEEDGQFYQKESLLYNGIRAWAYYPNTEDEESIFFPVGGMKEYWKDFEGLYNNPKRLHLAVHLLQYLRTNGI